MADKESFRPPWFWAHDITESQIPGLVTAPEASLAYLRAYGGEENLRYAAVVSQGIGGHRSWRLDLSAAQVTARSTDAEVPVGIDSHRSGGKRHFTLLTAAGSGTGCFVGADLTGDDVRSVLRSGNHVVDHTAYTSRSSCRYAVIFAPGSLPQHFVERVSARELRRVAAELRAWPVQIRSCDGSSVPHYSAVLSGTRPAGVRHSWYACSDADGLSRLLRKGFTGIADFHAFRNVQGVRFTVVTHSRRRRSIFSPFLS